MARLGHVEDPGYHKVSSIIARYVRSVQNPAATMATARELDTASELAATSE